jgi:hypothetical protein
MDRITTIETKIVAALNSIDGTTQSTGYKFYTNTGTIQVYDEVLSQGRNTTTLGETNKGVNYKFELQDSAGIQGNEWSTGQKAYTNSFMLQLDAKVHNVGDGTVHPKNEIRIKMNECFNDLLFAFARDYTLAGQVQSIIFKNAFRLYEDISNNRIQTGTLQTLWEVTFQQDCSNPDIPACW